MPTCECRAALRCDGPFVHTTDTVPGQCHDLDIKFTIQASPPHSPAATWSLNIDENVLFSTSNQEDPSVDSGDVCISREPYQMQIIWLSLWREWSDSLANSPSW